MPDISRWKMRDKTRSGQEGRAVSPGENSKDGFFGPPTAPNSFRRSLGSLRDLMELIPHDSGVRCSWRQQNLITTVTSSFMKQLVKRWMLLGLLAM